MQYCLWELTLPQALSYIYAREDKQKEADRKQKRGDSYSGDDYDYDKQLIQENEQRPLTEIASMMGMPLSKRA